MRVVFASDAQAVLDRASDMAREMNVSGIMSPMVVAAALMVDADFKGDAAASGLEPQDLASELLGSVVSQKGHPEHAGTYPLEFTIVERAAGHASQVGRVEIRARELIRSALEDLEIYNPVEVLLQAGWSSIDAWLS